MSDNYHRIVSPTLIIPTDPAVSIPVGILACQRDPLLRTLNTTVVTAKKSDPPAKPPQKGKKAVLAPALTDEPLLEVVLHDTVLFPEGGGQPTDTGVIHINTTVWDVVQVKRHGHTAVHYVRVPDANIDAALQAFSPGQDVTVALDSPGSERRLDHMSMHTSQHLLSAVLESLLSLPTLSWSLTASPAPCYVEVPRGMTPEEIGQVQAHANQLVLENRKIHVEVQELNDSAAKEEVPKANGRSVGKALPEDYTGGVKRYVVIDGVDRNPCCGTHLPSISNLQLFLIPHTETLSRSTTTCARLYFLAGPRLIHHLGESSALLTKTASVLSCGSPSVPDRVQQVITERKRAEKRVDELEAELARALADSLVQEMASTNLPDGKPFTKYLPRTDVDPNTARGILSQVSTAFMDGVEKLQTTCNYVLVMSSSPLTPQPNSTSLFFITGSKPEMVKQVGDAIKLQGVKGGGQGSRWSGKYAGVSTEKQASAIRDALETIRGV